MSEPRKRRQIDPHKVDMPELFGDLIRERGLYQVLNSMAQACRARADHYSQPRPDRHPTTVQLHEEESEYFQDAARDIESVVDYLQTEWKGREPICAHGDIRRMLERPQQLAREYYRRQMKEVAAVLRDPHSPQETRKAAVDSFAKEMEGTIWTSRETGEPDFKVSNNVYKLVLTLGDSKLSSNEQDEILTFLEDFVNR